MKSCERVSYITALACAIAENCSDEELALLAASLTQLADTISTILVQKEICETNTK